MPTAEDFFSRRGEQVVVGCYLSPRVLLAEPDWNDPIGHLRIGWRVPSGGFEFLVTVAGGFFVLPPPDLQVDVEGREGDLEGKLEFEEQVSFAMNDIICDLTLRGVVSEPAAPAFISRGSMIGDCIGVFSAGGGRESYADRTMDGIEVVNGLWRTRTLRPDVLDAALADRWAPRLGNLSRHAPTLTAGAYSNFSRMQYAEAMADAWIVIERFVDDLWNDYVAAPGNAPRRRSLEDTRSYTVAVRLEVLALANMIDQSLREQIDRARKHRNDLHHGARLGRDSANDVLGALWEVLKKVCDPSVAPPLETRGVSW
jgi:hypothetical protein